MRTALGASVHESMSRSFVSQSGRGIIFDEGTDTPGVQDPNGIGLATIDNILIDHEALIRRGP
jgi:hypothetical protein